MDLRLRHIVLLVATGLCFSGCDKKPEANPSKAEMGRSQVSTNNQVLAHDVVAVRIDGKDLTRNDIIRNSKVVLQLTMNKVRKTKIRHREVQMLERACRGAVSREISKAAVARYLHERNLSVPSNVIMRVTRRFEYQYGAVSKKLKRRHNLNDLKYMLGKNAFRADEMILEMALFETMTNDVVRSANIIISDKMVADRQEHIKAANERAAATNAFIFAKATNVWKKIVSGELTFESAASKFSEDEYIQGGCEWGCFTRDQLEGEEELLALLPTLKPGDITPPVESDGGLAILRKDEDDSDKTYSFSRVFFRLPYFYDEETSEQARAVLREHKIKDLIQATIKENIEKLKIEYPDGTNMVWKLTLQDF